eukprot:CAMPEP_0114421914 /NCGR_PEP_ID=MMETSP0103-20121206/5333_1 /TAXON_ID=37642 ORGANISM="Paraphysomonas imperforata, Strain PA2" /NCGR_SAMPLE_ID=MMETSP0103 /ASSEMBLY_ACC=CAM_ASM_000201 /LENGTH=1036 /DNA_ID=CAMNT_0001590469 /DNA_START=406 /DNA_END=3516 /DNA_ORIENTATION=-
MVLVLPGTSQTDVTAEASTRKRYITRKMLSYLPVLLSLFWILLGTVFYAIHDHLGWQRALFMSVSVGWSIGWSMEGLSEFDSAWSKLFTIYHTSIGVLFAGITILIVADAVGKNKDNWIMQVIKMKEYDAASETEGCWDSFVGMVQVHLPTLRIIFAFLVWFSFGLLWYPFTNPEFPMSKNVDWLMSTLTTGGYLTIPSTVGGYQLVVTALYTNIGVPLMSISLGLLMSLIIEASEDNLIFHRIIAPVTDDEIKFMQEFGIEDGDGKLDNKEFIIMAAMRIGGATPDLIRRINNRFKVLDRDNAGKVPYDEILTNGRNRLSSDAQPISCDTLESSARLIVSDRRRTRRNSAIFAARAKSVFFGEGSNGAEEIASNISRIEGLMSASPGSSVRSSTGSRRVTTLVRSSKSLICESDSESSDSDNDDGGGDDPPSRSVSKKYELMHIEVKEGQEGSDEEEGLVNDDLPRTVLYECDDVDAIGNLNENKYELTDMESSPVPDRSSISERLQCSSMDSIEMSDEVVRERGLKEQKIVEPTSQNLLSKSKSKSKSNLSFHTPKIIPINTPQDQTIIEEKSASNRREVSDSRCSAGSSERIKDVETGNMTILSTGESITISCNSEVIAVSELNASAINDAVDNQTVTFPTSQEKSSSPGLKSLAGVVDVIKDAKRFRSKHYNKLISAKVKRRLMRKYSAEKKQKGVWELHLMSVKKALTSGYAIAFYLWSLWLAAGTIFFTLEEDLTVCEGIFFSTSIGYGIFWNEQTSTNAYSTMFTCFHYFVGVLSVSFALAVFARSLNLSKKHWYADAKLLRAMRKASLASGRRKDILVYVEYYWPKVYMHFFLLVWVLLGIVWGVSSVQWSVLDAWLFAMTAMAKGGLVSLPSSGVHEWDYIFYSLYIVVGAPLMAVSCGTAANAISNYGRAQQKEKDLSAPMTEDELVMLNHLGIEDNDGFIDNAEFTLLLLVRIGALNPDLIGVLHDRYYELDMDGTGGGVTYEALLNRQSFMMSNRKLGGTSFRHRLSGSGGSALNKLRMNSRGG